MITNKEKLSSFKYEFLLPNKDFTDSIRKELTVSLEYTTTEKRDMIRGRPAGTNHFEDCYFIVNIPKYVLDFIKGKFKKYSKDKIGVIGTYDNGVKYYDENYNFKTFIKSENFKTVKHIMGEITIDALHIKELESLEKNNKVIFINSSYYNREMIDEYNFGRKGNKINLNFQYFVAFKVIKKREFFTNFHQDNTQEGKTIEYYALSSKKSFTKQIRRLPLLDAKYLKDFVQIEWTQAREDYFKDIENKINKVAFMVDDFVKDVNCENIDLKIETNNKLFLIED